MAMLLFFVCLIYSDERIVDEQGRWSGRCQVDAFFERMSIRSARAVLRYSDEGTERMMCACERARDREADIRRGYMDYIQQ